MRTELGKIDGERRRFSTDRIECSPCHEDTNPFPYPAGLVFMGLFDRLRWPRKKRAALSADENVPSLITVHDKFGRQYEVPREEWRTKVLPGNLQAAYDDADGLYGIIVMALNDGFFAELLDASQRLLAIDRDRERSHTVRAIVLLKNMQVDDAEKVLTGYLREFGQSGVVLTNLAKVYAAQDKTELSHATLWNAIQADPNQENGLMWWATLQQEKGGDDAFWRAMSQAAQLTGSWRPQLWLARRCLEDNRLEQAVRFYERIMTLAADQPGVLMMISGDLGNAGHVAEILRLILPVFDPQRHDAYAGLNLLQTCVATNNVAEGERLLHRMFALERPDLKEHLFKYAHEFDNLKQSAQTLPSIPAEQLSIVATTLDRPIWYYGLNDPRWLLSSLGNRSGEQVVFVSLANTSGTDHTSPTAQREDELGRLTRSIPLYLAESIFLWSDMTPRNAVPFVQGGGPVVYGAEWPEDQIFSLAVEAAFAVSGFLKQEGALLQLHLDVWDCSTRKRLKALDESISMDDVSRTVLDLERQLLSFLARGKADTLPRERYYRRPERDETMPYLVNLGQSLMMTCIRNGLLDKAQLWGERNMIESFQWLAIQSSAQVPRIMLLSALATAKAYGSDVLDEYRTQALQLIQDEKDKSSPFYRLSPILFKTFGMDEDFRNRCAELRQVDDPEYQKWLSGLGVQI